PCTRPARADADSARWAPGTSVPAGARRGVVATCSHGLSTDLSGCRGLVRRTGGAGARRPLGWTRAGHVEPAGVGWPHGQRRREGRTRVARAPASRCDMAPAAGYYALARIAAPAA